MSRILNFNDGFETATPSTVESITATTVVVTPTGNISSTDVQSALVELQNDINTANINIGLRETIANVDDIINTSSLNDRAYADFADDNHRNTVDGIHGIGGSVVGTFDAQVLTNKDIDGGTAANNSRITIPKDTKTNLDGLTRKEGTIVFDTVAKALYFDNGTILKQVLENNETPVVSRATDSSGQSISTGTVTIVNFNSVTYDTPSAITTGASWKYTHTGATAYFEISSNINLVSASGGGSLIIYLYKNGSLYSTNYTLASATAPYAVNLTDSIQLANTDFIDIRVLHNAGANRSLSANDSFITIKKIK